MNCDDQCEEGVMNLNLLMEASKLPSDSSSVEMMAPKTFQPNPSLRHYLLQ